MSPSLAVAGDAAEGWPAHSDSQAGESGGREPSRRQPHSVGLALALGAGREKQTWGKGKGKRGQGSAGSKRGREEEGGAQDGHLYYGVGTAEVVPGAAEPETLPASTGAPRVAKRLARATHPLEALLPSRSRPRQGRLMSPRPQAQKLARATNPLAALLLTRMPNALVAWRPLPLDSRWADTQAVAGQGQGPPAADMSPSLACLRGLAYAWR
eukprot:jgi/Tetstr1/465796/TSEL_010418.t1